MDDSILITTGTTLKGNVVLGLEESCFVETEAEDGTETLSVVLCVSPSEGTYSNAGISIRSSEGAGREKLVSSNINT